MLRRLPIGIKVLVAFFAFGACACAVTVAALLRPGSPLDTLWRLNPEAQIGFQKIGVLLSVALMLVVGSACAAAAIGLARETAWGRRLAIGVLVVNMSGDTLNALVRRDPRALIGLPIAGALIWFLWRKRRPVKKGTTDE